MFACIYIVKIYKDEGVGKERSRHYRKESRTQLLKWSSNRVANSLVRGLTRLTSRNTGTWTHASLHKNLQISFTPFAGTANQKLTSSIPNLTPYYFTRKFNVTLSHTHTFFLCSKHFNIIYIHVDEKKSQGDWNSKSANYFHRAKKI